MKNYLEFEKEIKTLEELDGLKSPFGSEGISEGHKKLKLLRKKLMKN